MNIYYKNCFHKKDLFGNLKINLEIYNILF